MARLHGKFLLEARAAVEETVHHLILRAVGTLTSEAVQLSSWAPAHESIALQGLVILNMLMELAKGVRRRGALSATAQERHVD